MSAITPENLSALLGMITGLVLFMLLFRLVLWNTNLGRLMRMSALLTLCVMAHSYCGATKPEERRRMMNGVRELLRFAAPQGAVLPQSETLSMPEYSDMESSASVGFKDELGCAVMEVAICAQCFNSYSNSFEIVFETGVADGSSVDMMIGFEDGAWMCAVGDVQEMEQTAFSVPEGSFELSISMTLNGSGRIADCRVTADGVRVPFLEQTISAANPRSWRKVAVYSRNGDELQPSIDVGSDRTGFIISIK